MEFFYSLWFTNYILIDLNKCNKFFMKTRNLWKTFAMLINFPLFLMNFRLNYFERTIFLLFGMIYNLRRLNYKLKFNFRISECVCDKNQIWWMTELSHARNVRVKNVHNSPEFDNIISFVEFDIRFQSVSWKFCFCDTYVTFWSERKEMIFFWIPKLISEN